MQPKSKCGLRTRDRLLSGIELIGSIDLWPEAPIDLLRADASLLRRIDIQRLPHANPDRNRRDLSRSDSLARIAIASDRKL
jgi:hypothetical protein